MYACLTALLPWEKKEAHGPRKLVMEMNNIMVLDKMPELVKNVPLYTLLFKHCETAERRVNVIIQLIIDYIYHSNEEGAIEALRLLWPSILELVLFWKPGGLIFADKYFPNNRDYTYYNLDLSTEDTLMLDDALFKYARTLDQLILTTLAYLKPGIQVPEQFIESASKELARVAHITSDPKVSGELFGYFIGRLVGHHYPVESCGLMKKAPSILRESLQKLPEREGRFVAENLFEYMRVLDKRFEHEDGRAQCEVLNEVSKVVSIGLCHHLNPGDIRKMFIEVTKKNTKI